MPCGFENIIGQESIKRMLQSSIRENKVSHAYIIEGDKGMGKKLIAATFAQYLVCSENTACGACTGCTAAMAGTHPDILTVTPEEGKKAVGVDDIRAVVAEASVKPYMAEKKVIILPECDNMTPAAQNALLKVLEEPPAYVLFLLLIQNSGYLLETVRSRSILIALVPYSEQEMQQGLRRYSDAPPENDAFALAYAGNNLGRAVSLAKDADFAAVRSAILEKLPLLTADNHLEVFGIVRVFEEYKESAQMLLDCMLSVVRDIILIKNDCADMIQNADVKQIVLRMEEKINMEGCMIIAADLLKAKEMLSRNVNYSLLITALINGSWEVIHGRNRRSLF